MSVLSTLFLVTNLKLSTTQAATKNNFTPSQPYPVVLGSLSFLRWPFCHVWPAIFIQLHSVERSGVRILTTVNNSQVLRVDNFFCLNLKSEGSSALRKTGYTEKKDLPSFLIIDILLQQTFWPSLNTVSLF